MKYQGILTYNILLIINVHVFHMQMEPLESAGLLSLSETNWSSKFKLAELA